MLDLSAFIKNEDVFLALDELQNFSKVIGWDLIDIRVIEEDHIFGLFWQRNVGEYYYCTFCVWNYGAYGPISEYRRIEMVDNQWRLIDDTTRI